jgi:hypothetical protein
MKTCTAYWRPRPGEELMCGEPAPRAVADTYFCDHHYERALRWAAGAARAEGSLVYYIQREPDSLIKIGTSRTIAGRWAALKRVMCHLTNPGIAVGNPAGCET